MIYTLKFFQKFLFYNCFIICVFSFCSLQANVNPSDEARRSRILYLFQLGKDKNAFELYRNYCKEKGHHDGELLEQIALILIEKGFNSTIAEAQVLALFGAGISQDERLLPLLKLSILSKDPKIQLIALNFLSRLQNDEADMALNDAMHSDFLEIRFEASFHLATKKALRIVGKIESLMQKVNEAATPLFPQFFALIGTHEAIKTLTRLINHPNEKVRVQAIISAAEHERDDLLPIIKKLSIHHGSQQQEALAYAFGKLKDESSIEKLEFLTLSNIPAIRLTALHALYNLGQKTRVQEITNMARELDLFAVFLLGQMEESIPLLISLSQHEQFNVRLNASIALLKLKNEACLPVLMEILIKDSRDLAYLETKSLGLTLTCLKGVPSAAQNFKDTEMLHELSHHLCENILIESVHLKQNDFLKLAIKIFESNQNALIPRLVSLLEELQTKEAIDLLKIYQQKPGAPLIRNYCNLALFRLKEPGPYRDNLEKFITKECQAQMIEFRPLLPFAVRLNDSHFQLTPQDTSKLLIEVFEALTLKQDAFGIDMLLHAIENGNQNNKYALAGLLMHATR